MPDRNCRKFRESLTETVRGHRLDSDSRRDLAAHLAACSQCVREFEAQQSLTAAFHDLHDGVPVAEAAGMEANLMAEFDRVNRRKKPQIERWMAIAAVLLVAAILAGRLLMSRMEAPPAPPVVRIAPPVAPVLEATAKQTPPIIAPRRAKPRKPVASPAEKIEPQPFIAIPYTVPLSPYERAEVVRMDLPVSAVIAAGLPLEVSDSGAHARADVLVGEDGRARAIRLLSISTFISK